MDAKTHLTHDELANRFAFHPADTQDKRDRHEAVRDTLLEAAGAIVNLTGPPTREQSTAITKLEEAMFWANAAIARATPVP
jgi:hypothetical protein